MLEQNRKAIAGLQPEAVWHHFAELASRPRPSGEEAAVRDYVTGWAEEKGFGWQRDEVGNVVVAIPGKGRGVSAPVVVIQGHLDMVCEKNNSVFHDFSVDPIQLVRKGERVFGNQTTLGADNGIGVALGLAAGEGLYADHPPLELLLTVDEETGMSGARELKGTLLTGRRMINLDAEEEGTLYVGCAGGLDTLVSVPLERELLDPKEDWVTFQLELGGLRGGHSGLDIGLNRGTAIRLMAQWLVAHQSWVRLVHFTGGSKRNAIPREASARVVVKAADRARFHSGIEMASEWFARLHGDSEGPISLQAEAIAPEVDPLTETTTGRLLDFLCLVPHGISSLSQTIAGLVETSNNLGVLEMEGDAGTIILCSRSSNQAALDEITLRITRLAERCGLSWKHHGGYPGWQPNARSEMLRITRRVFRELAGGKEPEVTAIHAGLECGLLGAVVPGMDMIAFGPDIQDAHSPDESVSIASVGVVAEQVRALLLALCDGAN